MSIRLRLTLQFTLLVAMLLLVFSAGIYYFSSSYREKDFHNRLDARAKTTAKLLFDVEEIDEQLLKIIDKNTFALTQERVEVYNSKFKLIYSSGDIYYDTVDKSVFNQLLYTKSIRYLYGLREGIGNMNETKDGHIFVFVSAYDMYGLARMANLRLVMVILLVISLIITTLLGFIFALNALNPMQSIIKQVNKITGLNLNLRIDEGNKKDEIAMLAITFNQMLQRVEMAFEMQKSFVANASHELRTPLALILGEIELTLKNERPTDEYQRILNEIYNDMKSLNSLSNNLLDLAHANFDVSNLEIQSVRVDEALLQARIDFLKHRKDYKVDVKFGEMPDNDEYLTIKGNEYFLRTAFLNLINNGCKYSSNQTVVVAFNYYAEKIEVSFTDNGIGIPTEEQDKIFQPFYRASNVNKQPGHGLGLALVDRIISLHKGTITIISAPMKGASFQISFPLQ